MTLPLSERALREIVCRLKKIRQADEYQTDAGRSVYRAIRALARKRIRDDWHSPVWIYPRKVCEPMTARQHSLFDKRAVRTSYT